MEGGKKKKKKTTLIPINAGDCCDVVVNITSDQSSMQVLFPRKTSMFIIIIL